MANLIVIPARLASTRFPDKPLVEIAGVSMIKRVVAIAKASTLADHVVVATDDHRLKDHLDGIVEVIMTSAECATGSDRVAQVSAMLSNDFELIFSLQGDAVLTPPWIIDDVFKAMMDEPQVDIATPAVKLHGTAKEAFLEHKVSNPSSGTCVTFDHNKHALYFSKQVIPFDRDGADSPIYRHIGLYGYRAKALADFTALKPTPLEQIEKLEQLRALENGMTIKVVEVDYKGRTHGSVDNPDDVSLIETIIEKEGEVVL